MCNGSSIHLYVISDLHLGGKPEKPGTADLSPCSGPGRRRLAQFICYLRRRQHRGQRVHLVINGDIVDFFTEVPFAPYTEDENLACAKLRNIIYHTKIIWRALRLFVQSGGQLTLLLGNHDVELSHPAARRLLREVLGPGTVEIIYDNEALNIGDVVLIEHGHTWDAWNAIDNNSLRTSRAERSRRREPEKPFTPPPGSVLVTRLLNKIKTSYPPAEFLKPELHMGMGLLLGIDPTALRYLPEALALMHDKKSREVFVSERHAVGRDQSESSTGTLTSEGVFAENMQLLHSILEPAEVRVLREQTDHITELSASLSGSHEPAHQGAPKAIRSPVGRDPTHDRSPPQAEQVTSRALTTARVILRYFAAWLNRDDPDKLAHHLVNALAEFLAVQDQVLDTRIEADQYLKIARHDILEGKFKVVVYGHTHLAKQIPIFALGEADQPPAGWYLNSGTWVDLMFIPRQALKDRDASVLADLIQDIKATGAAGWRRQLPTYAYIELQEEEEASGAGSHLVVNHAGVYLFKLGRPREPLPDTLNT